MTIWQNCGVLSHSTDAKSDSSLLLCRPRRDATLLWADSSGAKATITLIGQQMETVCRNHVCLNHAKRTKSWARAIVRYALV